MSERRFYVLAYDIPDDRRRVKIARLCESIAERVQGSVFEGYLTPKELERLLVKIDHIFEYEQDSMRVYQLCADCQKKVQAIGIGRVTRPPQVIIV